MNLTVTKNELALHTLRGIIQELGMDSSYNKRRIRKCLEFRYVHGEGKPVTQAEFDSVLDEEYKKVVDWRKAQ